MILFLNFEKAFDFLKWEYLFEVLDAMSFGLSFHNWIRTFFNNVYNYFEKGCRKK